MEDPWRRVKQTLEHSRDFRDLRRFLLCVLFYQAGITAVVSLAAIYAEQAMQFTMQQTIVLILVVNVTAALGAFGFGYLQDAIGHVKAVAITLAGWIVMVLIAGTTTTPEGFWLAANLAGLCMGSAQAAGRAIVGYLAPPARLAEFFGLWGLAMKAASIAYFVIGLALLKGIDTARGRRAALGDSAR
jgi:UMF1 family MFS transporter